jgi:hypothetical protein
MIGIKTKFSHSGTMSNLESDAGEPSSEKIFTLRALLTSAAYESVASVSSSAVFWRSSSVFLLRIKFK